MSDTMEKYGVVYGAPIDGMFDGEIFPDGLKHGDEVLVRWSHCETFDGPYSVPNIWAGEGAQFRAKADHPIYAFGPEIAVDGKPAWFGDYDGSVMAYWAGAGTWYTYSYGSSLGADHAWPWLTAIRLPADHWVYPVIAKGFEPWGGGDEAPVDATGEIMHRNGCVNSDRPESWVWGNSDCLSDIIGYRKRTFAERVEELIETLAAPEPTFKAGDWIVPLGTWGATNLTTGQAYQIQPDGRIRDNEGPPRFPHADLYRSATPAEIHQCEALAGTVTIPKMTEEEWNALIESHNHSIFPALRQLGILKSPPTLLEQFEEHHGGLDDNQRAILEIYQEWVAGL